MLALNAAAHTVLGDHLVHGEVLAHVTQELEHRDTGGPVGVVHQRRLVRPWLEVEQPRELPLDALHVVPEGVDIEQVAFLAAATWIADHSRRAACQGKRPVTGKLEAAHEQLTHEVAHVQRVGGGVEPDVHPHRPLIEARLQGSAVGGVVKQATGFEVGEQIHSGSNVARSALPFPHDIRDTVVTMQPTFDVLESIERQAVSCDHIGSPLYGSLMRGFAADYRSSGITRELLEHASERPQHDGIPLRYIATGHRLALAGAAPQLARHFPSCGGAWDGSDITADFLDAVAAHRHDFVVGLTHQVQTNEVGRAVPLVCGLAHVQQRFGLPMRLLELGASAGLLSRAPWYRIDTGSSACGPEDSPVRFGSDWFATPPAQLPVRLDVCDQAAVDLSPIDVATNDGRLAIQSFVWPDQLERIERLRAALIVADAHPMHVERADAGAWLSRHVEAPLPAHTATVVFHTIVWQYLPAATRDHLRRTLTSAAAHATVQNPLCWLRMEPATPTHADLRLTVWPSGAEIHLADVGYHGHGLEWLVG